MENCKYDLQFGGKKLHFRSKTDLNAFLYNNREKFKLKDEARMSLEFGPDYNPQSESIARLQSIRKTGGRVKRHVDGTSVEQIGEKIESSDKETITGSNVHEQRSSTGRQLVTSTDMKNYKANEVPKLVKSGKYTQAEAELYLDDLIESWKVIAKNGTLIHTIPEFVFGNPDMSDSMILDEINKLDTDKIFTDRIILDAIESFRKLKTTYLDKIHPDAKYFTEVVVEHTDETGQRFKGVIDLVVIDNKGVPHIYDFKSSTKHISNFHQIKEQTYTYQLGFYRQLLGALGFDVTNSKLGIIPIHAEMNRENTVIDNLAINADDVDILTERRAHHLGYGMPSAYIWKELNRVLSVPMTSFAIGTNYVTETTELVKDILGYEPKLGITYKDVKKWMRNKNNIKLKNGVNKYFDVFADGGNGDWVTLSTIDPEGQITEYLTKLNSANLTAASNMGDSLVPYLDGSRSIVKSNKEKAHRFEESNFKEYYQSGWKLNRELEQFGVIILYHEADQVFDVINVTANGIQEDYQMTYGSTVLGQFLNDQQVQDSKILSSNIGNIELLRSMFLINELVSSGNSLSGYKFGSMKVMNFKGDMSFFQNQVMLHHSFNRLIKLYNKKNNKNIENNFDNGKIQIETFEDRILRTFQAAIDSEHSGIPNDKNILAAFSADRSADIIDRLTQLMDEISSYGADATTKEFKTKASKLSFLVAEAINHYKDLNFEYSVKDKPKWSWPGRGTMLSLSTYAADNYVKEFENKVNILFTQKVQDETNEVAARNRTALEPMRKEGFHLGTGMNMFDNCFETTNANSTDINQKFRTKNPYDPKVILTKGERTYLKYFLLELNKLRYPDITSDDCPEAKALQAAGTWFDVPLIRGKLVNRVTKGGSVKEYWNDVKDEATNVNQHLSQEAINEEEYNHTAFKEFINSADINPTKRTKLLAEKGTSYFSRDLNYILDFYASKKIRQNASANVLPIARAALIFHHGFYNITNIEAKELQDHLLMHLQSKVYDKMHVPTNQKKLAGNIKALQGVAAKLALGGNIFSATRETVQGIYNNFLRACTKHSVLDMPSVGTLTKAYMEVSPKMLGNLRHNSKINGLMMMFHGLTGGSLSSLAEDVGAHTNRLGGKLFNGDVLMKLNLAPDFLNRGAMLIGFMMKDGCYDAHIWKGEMMTYDWTLDKRFDVISKYINDPDKVPTELKEKFAQQKGLYSYMIRALADENIINSKTGKHYQYGEPLPRAYSANQIATIKDIIDSTHGHMSGYAKTQLERLLYGGMVFMFKSYVKTKVNNYTLKGGYYAQGEVKETFDEDGNPLYIHTVLDSAGNKVREYIDTDPTNGTRQYEFIQYYQEGIIDSFRRAWEMYKNDQKGEILKDENIKKNMKYFAADIFTCMCLFALYNLAFEWEELEEEYGYTATRLMKVPFEAPMDNNPVNFGISLLGSTEPPLIAIAGSLLKSITNVSAIGDGYVEGVANNVAAYRIAADITKTLTD